MEQAKVPTDEQRQAIRVAHPFGPWLLAQRSRRDQWIGQLARLAAADPGFPRQGTAEQVRSRIQSQGLDHDMCGALYDALAQWRDETDLLATRH